MMPLADRNNRMVLLIYTCVCDLCVYVYMYIYIYILDLEIIFYQMRILHQNAKFVLIVNKKIQNNFRVHFF